MLKIIMSKGIDKKEWELISIKISIMQSWKTAKKLIVEKKSKNYNFIRLLRLIAMLEIIQDLWKVIQVNERVYID